MNKKIDREIRKLAQSTLKEMRLVEKSQYYKKTLNYIKELILTNEFQTEVLKIRKKYGVPPNGGRPAKLDFSKGDIIELSKTPGFELLDNKDFQDDVRGLGGRWGLDPTWDFSSYIMFNHGFEHAPIFTAIDIINIGSKSLNPVDAHGIKQVEELKEARPIAILISPYASQRDILDYVKKLYKTRIEPLQKLYKRSEVKLGRIKNKNAYIQKRNDFIYSHRDKPRRQIMKMIGDKFGPSAVIDYGSIGKIISLELKRRK